MNYFKIFDFIPDTKLKRVLVLDYKEVLTCLKRQCYKGAVVLAGGIVEALLKNKALSLPSEAKDKLRIKYFQLSKKRHEIRRMDLFNLIKALAALKFISSPSASRCDVLRDYRNLIHPFKDGKRPNKRDAISVKKLLDDLVIEFGKAIKQKTTEMNRAMLFFTHSKWDKKREKAEYMEILRLFGKKPKNLTFEELLKLRIFKTKENPSKSLIACLNYLMSQNICSYDKNSRLGPPINRYENWNLSGSIKSELKKYLNIIGKDSKPIN
ncbi:MAG: hypothetical protein ABIB61_03170 [Candidatus Shapirobacteria bacterium]